MNRKTKKAVKKIKSYISRGDGYGKFPKFVAVDEILPPPLYCNLVELLHFNDVQKLNPFNIQPNIRFMTERN